MIIFPSHPGYWNIIVHGRKHSYRLYTKMLNEAMRWANAIQAAIDSKVPIETPTQQLIRDIKVFTVFPILTTDYITFHWHFCKSNFFQSCKPLARTHTVIKWGTCTHYLCAVIFSWPKFFLLQYLFESLFHTYTWPCTWFTAVIVCIIAVIAALFFFLIKRKLSFM